MLRNLIITNALKPAQCLLSPFQGLIPRIYPFHRALPDANAKRLSACGYLLILFMTSSCNYLDVVPDNIPTVDHAFNIRAEAANFLFGCYSYMPLFGDAGYNPAILGGDEAWFIDNASGWSGRLWNIARGQQSATAPLAQYWASAQQLPRNDNGTLNTGSLIGGTCMFTALSECNIFLENIHIPYDLGDEERTRWIAEVKFLKAFYHFWLFRMYGPVPLIRENTPVSAKGEEAWIYREPVDEVVKYICSLLDEALEDLPEIIYDQQIEMGRATKVMALSLKAQTLLWAASPLLNGTVNSPPEFSLIDNRKIELFPRAFSYEKWQLAADAAKEAIDAAVEAGNELYDFRIVNPAFANAMDEKSVLAMQVRGAATERWNREIIWADSRGGSNTNGLQRACHPVFTRQQNSGGGLYRTYAPTLQVVEQFYTKNGLPVEEDREWAEIDPFRLRTSTANDRFHVSQDYRTVQLHFDREARFYASVMFDGGLLYGNGRILSDVGLWVTELRAGNIGGGPSPLDRHSSTGNIVKKMLHFRTSVPDASSAIVFNTYGYPIIRLADLYLMYAEALNEAGGTLPHQDVYTYVDAVRERSGLNGVVESWRDYAIAGMENKPLTREGMREIIRRERLNELAFESSRFWDLRRWKLAEEYMNRPVRGWNIWGESPEDFYDKGDKGKGTEIYQMSFQKRDYFWPIRTNTVLRNANLVQNPGW